MTTPACRVERLRLYRFRNYAEQTVEFGPGVNVVLGPNAQGKTNLLEAVATLALSRSPRAATAAELISWDAQECQLQARLQRPTGATEVSLRLRRGVAGAVPRTISVDGTPRRARALLGVCPVVLFWPEDLLLVKAGPEGGGGCSTWCSPSSTAGAPPTWCATAGSSSSATPCCDGCGWGWAPRRG